MAYLQKLDIDYLKIDQSFIRDIATNHANRTIAETIIVMAHRLGLKVIAEGIETPEQLNCLEKAGCDFGQGFLFSPAVPLADFERILMKGHIAQPGLLH
jgi:EAL domain-containing protein (putative c-di-GMP-specific phosphodiesterase class I)